MEIKTKFFDEYTNKIDKLLNNSNHALIAFISLLGFGFVFSFFV